MIMTMNHRSSVHAGFTLVETLVAITILSIAIIGPFHAVQSALNGSYTARDYLAASALAQEGMEQVRYIRGNNYLYNVANPSSTRSWLYGLDGSGGTPSCGAPAKCTVDTTNLSTPIAVCLNGTCSPLSLSTTNLYNQAEVGTVTRFTRSVTITSSSANEATVDVTVTWISAHTPYSVTVTSVLTNWL
ncbi:MAG: putative Type IV pilus pilin [Parcubacteria bacterium C7867-001]|nr:MAG: putative Type IV pilus pilin [Parcubacteria bacterium C7867-001]